MVVWTWGKGERNKADPRLVWDLCPCWMETGNCAEMGNPGEGVGRGCGGDLMPQGCPYQEDPEEAWGLKVVFPTPAPQVWAHSTRAWPALSPSLPQAQEKGP